MTLPKKALELAALVLFAALLAGALALFFVHYTIFHVILGDTL